jgi:hypothetical protein
MISLVTNTPQRTLDVEQLGHHSLRIRSAQDFDAYHLIQTGRRTWSHAYGSRFNNGGLAQHTTDLRLQCRPCQGESIRSPPQI